jgi:hypothetical protein
MSSSSSISQASLTIRNFHKRTADPKGDPVSFKDAIRRALLAEAERIRPDVIVLGQYHAAA